MPIHAGHWGGRLEAELLFFSLLILLRAGGNLVYMLDTMCVCVCVGDIFLHCFLIICLWR